MASTLVDAERRPCRSRLAHFRRPIFAKWSHRPRVDQQPPHALHVRIRVVPVPWTQINDPPASPNSPASRDPREPRPCGRRPSDPFAPRACRAKLGSFLGYVRLGPLAFWRSLIANQWHRGREFGVRCNSDRAAIASGRENAEATALFAD
jgi:hypothetical protein